MRKFWRVMIVLIAVLSAVTLVGCAKDDSTSSSAQTETKTETAVKEEVVYKVGMIAEIFGTQSYNDDVKDGLTLISDKLGIDSIAMEVPEVVDTANSLRTLIMQGCNIIVIGSANYKDGMIEVADEYPEVKFIYLSEPISGYGNIMSVMYAENEGAYLLGVLAGLLTQSNNVGAVLAIKGDAVQEKYQFSFTAGVKSVNPDCVVQIAYTNSYADINKGNEVATAMYTKGADIVGTYSGACNLGVFNAAKQAGEGKYAFGAAKGQFDQMPDKIIASLVKPIDQALLSVVSDYIDNGTFYSDEPMTLGLLTNGVVVKYTDMNDDLLAMIDDEMKSTLDDVFNKITSGEIKTPASQQEYDALSL